VPDSKVGRPITRGLLRQLTDTAEDARLLLVAPLNSVVSHSSLLVDSSEFTVVRGCSSSLPLSSTFVSAVVCCRRCRPSVGESGAAPAFRCDAEYGPRAHAVTVVLRLKVLSASVVGRLLQADGCCHVIPSPPTHAVIVFA